MSPSAKAAMRITWSWPGTIVLFVILTVVMLTPVMPTADGMFFPVTSKVEFLDIKPVEGGLSVRMKFNKLRDCEFLGVTIDREGVGIDFEPLIGGEPMTLPTGQRISRPWFIGTTNIDGIRLRWVHRCVIWWNTVTQGYP
jgi:hypothetical protein